MVIGVCPFEVEYLESASGLPVSSWVYPQNRDEGFYDYSVALGPLDFFENILPPFLSPSWPMYSQKPGMEGWKMPVAFFTLKEQ